MKEVDESRLEFLNGKVKANCFSCLW